MAISLSDRRRWQFAAGLVIVACVYLFLTGTEFAASVFASRPDLPALERAVRLSPGNADYRHRLGPYLTIFSAVSPSAIQTPRSPAPLPPPHAPSLFRPPAPNQVPPAHHTPP